MGMECVSKYMGVCGWWRVRSLLHVFGEDFGAGENLFWKESGGEFVLLFVLFVLFMRCIGVCWGMCVYMAWGCVNVEMPCFVGGECLIVNDFEEI